MALPFTSFSIDEEVLAVNEITREEKVRKVEKVHKIMGHPREEALLSLFKNSSDDDEETIGVVKEVSKNCEACI